MTEFLSEIPLLTRTFLIIGVVMALHLVVHLLRVGGEHLTRSEATASIRKLRTVISLGTSVTVFTAYFLAVGFILQEFGISMTAYLASASVIGLAVGFGSQGVVQDVVTGLTLIFSNLVDIGEMVNIGGQIGIVRSIGMRFIVLENSFGALVSIPNRTITNVVSYPRGYVRSIVDITLSEDDSVRAEQIELAERLMPSVEEQFPGIMRYPPSVEARIRTSAGREFLRLKFRIWPDRPDPIAQSFRQELLHGLKKIDPAYADWMVAVHFEVEKPFRRALRSGLLRRRPPSPASPNRP
jgi:moderate conductance mechanosensitive channel